MVFHNTTWGSKIFLLDLWIQTNGSLENNDHG